MAHRPSRYMKDEDGDLWLVLGDADEGKVMLVPAKARVRFEIEPDPRHRIVRALDGLVEIAEGQYEVKLREVV